MPRKAKRARKRRISAREFTKEFTKIVGDRLAKLPAAEQTKRIRAAERVLLRHSRVASSTARGPDDTRPTALSARTRE
jgi:hypothetical protein